MVYAAVGATAAELARRATGYICEHSEKVAGLFKKIARRPSKVDAAVAPRQQSFQQHITAAMQLPIFRLHGSAHGPAADFIFTTNFDTLLIAQCKDNRH
jgi:hypothetical protein